MAAALRFGLIGAGYMGRAHAIALKAVAAEFGEDYAVDCAVLADHTLEAAQHASRALGFARASGDWRELLEDPSIDLHQSWLTSYDLEPYLLFKAIQGPYTVIEHPVTVRYHAEGYTKMNGVRDWWRLFRPAVLLRLRIKS